MEPRDATLERSVNIYRMINVSLFRNGLNSKVLKREGAYYSVTQVFMDHLASAMERPQDLTVDALWAAYGIAYYRLAWRQFAPDDQDLVIALVDRARNVVRSFTKLLEKPLKNMSRAQQLAAFVDCYVKFTTPLRQCSRKYHKTCKIGRVVFSALETIFDNQPKKAKAFEEILDAWKILNVMERCQAANRDVFMKPVINALELLGYDVV